MIIILGIIFCKVISGASNNDSDMLGKDSIHTISASNYTNVLKVVHENIDDYVGKKISFTGYVYRVYDLNDNQFILARNMIIDSKSQSVVVGFLSEYDNAKDLEDGTWVEITGEITKGEYHGEMPIVKITKLEKVSAPSEEFVFPPDDTYIPTSTGL